MAEAKTKELMTIEDLRQISEDEHPGELVRGEWVEVSRPTFQHGRLTNRIGRILGNFVEEHGLGEVVSGDPGFVLERRPDTLRSPDVAFVSKERIPSESTIDDWFEGAPDLAVEIVSKSQTAHDAGLKALDYLKAGTKMVWVIDPQSRTVAVYTPPNKIQILRENETLEGGEVLPGFQCKVSNLFGS
ncbi:MAG: Uma2 family endonuclease [Armatimonadetes bacterium]|nr:Uma2 family endonuclease [Armatimonadota bacterium]